ncbi:MAG: branched-chain amino acid transport system substrate-binding protein [Candidatus Parcubacteria bacterium]|jgi:branched-chain amino acid transport system substrate-binding protein|nr:branched-chain amino acid transport system substrate-binding protein [Candidatus Parcubacteria bacterium]
MNKNSRPILGVIIAILIIVVVAVSANRPADEKIIKIGLIAPLSGPGEVFGKSVANAIALAEDDLKDTKYKYELLIEDDGTNPAQSASAAHKLIVVEKVQALISMTSGTGNAVKPIATANKVPNICVCSDISVADGAYNFTNLILPDDEARGWLVEAQKRGIKSIAILHQNQQGINAIVASIEELAPVYGITVTFNQQFDPTVRDFKTVIAQAAVTKPDLYYVVSFPPSLDIIGQQLSDFGITNISASATFGISAKPELFEGKWYNDANVADLAFRTRFEDRFPGIRFNVRSAPFGYDSFMMLVNGFEKGGNINQYLSSLTSFDGKAGKITKSNGSRSFHSEPALWIIKDGKSEPLYPRP